MKIGIDARLWNQTGVGRYIKNLVINLQEIDKNNSYVLFVTKKDQGEVSEKVKSKNWRIIVANSRWHSLSEQVNFPRIIEKEKVDLMHFPYFSIPIFYKKPYVVTIHDLILHHFPTGKASTLPIWLYGFKMLSYRFVINNAAANARKVIAVSNSTKDEIVDHLRVNKANIEVIYEGADDFKNEGSDKSEFKDYFLYVGNVYPHKNAEKLLDAFKILSEKNQKTKLVFVGQDDYFYQRFKKSARKFGDRVVFVYNADDKKLSSLYRGAIALVRPSLMEGFSLPPLEAMMSGCLVVASDIPVHHEIFGDSIIYFDPKNVYDIVSKMEEASGLSNDQKRKFIEKGLTRSKDFSWKTAAHETLKVYESSIGV